MDTQIQINELLSMLTPQQFEALASSLAARGLADDLIADKIDPGTLQTIAREVWHILEQPGEAAS